MTPARARTLIALALAVGVAGDVLLRGDGARLGVLLVVVLLVVALVASGALPAPGSAGAPEERERWWIAGGAVLAASGLILRDAEDLQVLDNLSVLAMGALWAWHARSRSIARFTLEDAPRAGILAGTDVVTGASSVLRLGLAEPMDGDAASARSGRRRDLVIGALIAIPPLVVAAALLGGADPLMERWFSRWTAFISEEAIGHLFLAAILSWAVLGWSSAPLRLEGAVPSAAPELRFAFPFRRLAPTLYGLSALFAVFLGSQLRVLFGGAAYIAETSGLTLAEYARDGFFDLVAVTGVVLGVLYVADRLLGEGRAEDARHFRVAGSLLLLLVTVPIISAFVRMSLYVQHFGLSVDRLNAVAAMIGIAVALSWFGLTTLRGRRARFGPGMLVVTSLWVAALNLANPEAIVVRVNTARAASGSSFDIAYHLRLSADARPGLWAALAVLPPDACRELRTALETELSTGARAPRDWQSWNIPRSAWRLGSLSGDSCERSAD